MAGASSPPPIVSMSRAGRRSCWPDRPGIGKTTAIQDSRSLADSGHRRRPRRSASPQLPRRYRAAQRLAGDRRLFVAIGGPNPSLPPTSAYSEAHFEKARGLIDVDRYDAFVFDSITQVGRESYRYAEAYPDSPPRGGGKDTRAAYGQHARQMIAGLQHAQRGAPNKVIVMTAILERLVDDAKSRENGVSSCRATRPLASCLALSITSSPQLGRLRRRQAADSRLYLQAQRLGLSRRKLARTGSTRSSRRTSEN